MEFGSEIKLSEFQLSDWEIQKKRGWRKRRRYNPKDEETANTTQEEEICCLKNPGDNNIRDSSITESLKDSIHPISTDDAGADAIVPAGKSTEESEKSSSTEEIVSGSKRPKMLDFDLNELPPLEDEE